MKATLIKRSVAVSSALLAATLALAVGTTRGTVLASAATPKGQDIPDRFKDDRERLVGSWIYDDMAAAFAEAKKTGKPMMIVFR